MIENDFSSIEMSDDQLKSAERFNEIDLMFNNQIISTALKHVVSFLLKNDDDIARIHVWRLITFTWKANLLFVSTA